MKNDNPGYKFCENTIDEWYTKDFISSGIINHLKETGYRIHKEEVSKIFQRGEKVIIASKYLTKEIIEIKGLAIETNRSKLLKETAKSISNKNSFTDTFSEILLNSFINFGKYYSDQSSVMAMGIPNVEKCKTIIERVQDYFVVNKLSLKLYLVNQNGSLEVSNLNKGA